MEKNGNLVEKFRNTQINLKKENCFYHFFKTEAHALYKEIRNLYLLMQYNQKKLNAIHIETLSNKSNSKSSYISSFYSPSPSSVPKYPPIFKKEDIATIANEFSQFSTDETYLSHCCLKVLKTNDDDLIRSLVFSTIPSIFLNLLCEEYVVQFLKFMKFAIQKHYHLAIVLGQSFFTTPLFIYFLNEVTSNLDINSPNYISDFESSWKKNAKFCPACIIEMFSYADDPSDFLFKSLFENVCKSLHTYHLFPLLAKSVPPTSDSLSEHFKRIAGNLWTHLRNASKDATVIPDSTNLSYFMPDFHKTIVLTFQDINVIKVMSSKTINFGPVPDSDVFPAFVFQFPREKALHFTKVEELKGINFPNDVEGKLREILLLIDDFLVYSPSSYLCKNDSPYSIARQKSELTVSEIIENQLIYMPTKMLLSLKLSHLRPLLQDCLKKKDTTTNEIDYFTNLLQQGYDEREKERENCIKDLSLLNDILSCMTNVSNDISRFMEQKKRVLTFFVIGKWFQTIPVANYTLDEITKLYSDDDYFEDFFKKYLEASMKWCELNNYKLEKKDIIGCLYNNIMTFFSFQKYLDVVNSYLNEDQTFCSNVDAIMKKGKVSFIEYCHKLVGDNMLEKLKPSIDLLRSCDGIDQPILKMDTIINSLEMLANLLQILGVVEIGADQIEPCLFYLFSIANWPHFISTLHYIDHFIQPLRSFGNNALPPQYDRIRTSMVGFIQLITEQTKTDSEDQT